MRFGLAMSVLLLVACSGGGSRNSPDFKTGYSDGCATASQESADKRGTSPIRDEALYAGNAAYHSGWGSGLNACRAAATDRAPMGDPLAMPKLP